MTQAHSAMASVVAAGQAKNAEATEKRPDITVSKLAERYARRTARASLHNMAHALRYFGERTVGSLRRADYLEFREKRQESLTKYDRPPKNSTLNLELRQFNAMMRWGLDEEIIDANPFDRVTPLKAKKSRNTVIDPVDLDAALVDARLLVRVFQVVCVETGMRNGSEVRRMEWSHIDWGRSYVHVPAENVKTKNERDVPLTEYAKEAIREMPRVAGSRFVFANPVTRAPYSRGYLHSLSRQYLNRLTPGPGDERVVTHDGRHGLVSRLIRLGVPTFKSMKIVGHESAHMHWRYDHLSEGDRENAKSLLDAARKAPHRSEDDKPVDSVKIVKHSRQVP